MRACDPVLKPGDWMTVPFGVYAGIEGRVLEVREVCPLVLRARLTLPWGDDCWLPLWNEPMTEQEWLCTNDTALLERYLSVLPEPPSPRKCRLFACACARRAWDFLPPGPWREAIEAGERFADGKATEAELNGINRALALAWTHRLTFLCPLVALPSSDRERTVVELLAEVRHGVGRIWPTIAEADAHRDLLRDVFGNPFRPPVIDPGWLAWEGGVIVQLARTIYDERRWDEMSVLADALEDAGCDDEAILGHGWRPGLHARGCWLLDALLVRDVASAGPRP
jgi:hypothetical protein